RSGGSGRGRERRLQRPRCARLAGGVPLAEGGRAGGRLARGARLARAASAGGRRGGAAAVRVGDGRRVRPHDRGRRRRRPARRPDRRSGPHRRRLARVAAARSDGEGGTCGLRDPERRDPRGVGAGVGRRPCKDGSLTPSTASRETQIYRSSAHRRTSARRRRWLALLALVAVAGGVALWLGPGEKALREITLPLRHEDIIRQQAREKHLDPALIAAVIYQESKFSDRTSAAGAKGLMQILPSTAKFIAKRSGGTAFV